VDDDLQQHAAHTIGKILEKLLTKEKDWVDQRYGMTLECFSEGECLEFIARCIKDIELTPESL
jgi:hypothetical protein